MVERPAIDEVVVRLKEIAKMEESVRQQACSRNNVFEIIVLKGVILASLLYCTNNAYILTVTCR